MLLTVRAADSSRGEVGHEYRVERNRASSTSVLESRAHSDSRKGRIRPALVAGLFYCPELFRMVGSKPALRSAWSGDVTVRSRGLERRSLTTEGSRHRVMRISRFAWRDKPQICTKVALCGKANFPVHDAYMGV